jgi:hypothetical protein
MTQDEFQEAALRALRSISNSLDSTNLRLDGVDSRLDSIDKRLSQIEDRLRKIEKFVATDNADFMNTPIITAKA